MSALDGTTAKEWLENMVMCFALREYTSNIKVCRVVFQLKGELSSMVEEAPTAFEHGSRRCFMRTI
jgi:hypothetical protein